MAVDGHTWCIDYDESGSVAVYDTYPQMYPQVCDCGATRVHSLPGEAPELGGPASHPHGSATADPIGAV